MHNHFLDSCSATDPVVQLPTNGSIIKSSFSVKNLIKNSGIKGPIVGVFLGLDSQYLK